MSYSGIPNPRYHSATPSAIPTTASGRLTPSGRSTPSQLIPASHNLNSSTSSIPTAPSRSFTPTLTSTSRSNTPSNAIRNRTSIQPSSSLLHRTISTSSSSTTTSQSTATTTTPPSHIHRSPSPTNTLTPLDSAGSSAVQVLLRIRPSTYDYNVPSRFQRTVINQIDPTSVAIESPPPGSALANPASNPKSSQTFIFDHVFGPDDGQQELWTSVESIIHRFIEGFNVTILAYGQTSSGKSYTMGTDRFSDDEDPDDHLQHPLDSDRTGIIPRAIYTIFDKIQQLSSKPNQITVKASYLELYNEELIDLIASSSGLSPTLPQVTIREDKDGKIICSGLKEVHVTRAADALSLLQQGSQVRQTNSTEMNAQSSRSHAIFTLNLSQSKPMGTTNGGHNNKRFTKTASSLMDDPECSVVTSKLHFVDLAGSERLKRTAAVGGRAKEGISINAGLHALGNVISALGDPAKLKTVTHIPYRDSKLTRLLQDSLGGNAHTLMIACVSPSEHNLGETLNTLKYANRARNIKNRAQVNAQEVGWEDVEYLQSTIIKLRKELARLKNSSSSSDLALSTRVLSSIHEEDSASDELNPKFLDLKGDFTELQAKYAKTLSDLAQAQHSIQVAHRQSGQSPTLSQSAFEDMIQPIVEEYEKSITALESQLALTKAALVHSEHSMAELEVQLTNEQAHNENQSNYLVDLQTRLNRLVERESENETYIRNLEVKLKTLSDSEEFATELVIDLKREIARLKEQDSKSEAYIKDLESRLSRNASVDLSDQLTSLEAALADRDERYAELQAKFEALVSQSNNRPDSYLWEEQQKLIEKLNEKEAVIQELQTTLEQLPIQKKQIELERQKLEATTRERSAELAECVKLLGSSDQARSVSVGSDPSKRSRQSIRLSVATQDFTPPDTPAALSEPPVSASDLQADERELLQEFQDLQERYENTVSDLDQVTAKYNNSRKELEDMSLQLEDLRIVQSSSSLPTPRRSLTNLTGHPRFSGSNFGSPLPSPVSQSPSLIHPANSHPGHGILPVRGFGAPVTGGRSSKYLEGKTRLPDDETCEELDLNLRQDNFDGLQNGVILSRANSHRSISINTSIKRPPNRISSGSTPGSALPHGRSMSLSLSNDSSILKYGRGKSATRTLSDSRTVTTPTSRLGDQLTPTHGGEQSYESLQKEVIQLQEVLKEREDEIRNLEISIREIRRWSDTATPPQIRSSSEESEQSEQSPTESKPDPRSLSATGVPFNNKQVVTDVSSLSPDKALETIHSEILSKVKAGNASKDSQNIQLLDDLMRSMAQKESAHLELIDNLKHKLDSTKRQYDALVKLSRDQVVNMSSEIEALRNKLTQPDASDPQKTLDPNMADRLSKLDEQLRSKEQELEDAKAETKSRMLDLEDELLATKHTEIQAIKAQHDSEVGMLKFEQRHNLNQLIATSEGKLKAMQAELERVEEEWEAKLKQNLAAQADKIRAEFDEERTKLVETTTKAHEKALKDQHDQFDTETHQLLEQHALVIEKLETERDQSLKQAQFDFEAQIKEIKDSHASEVTRITTALCSRASEGNNTLEKVLTGHQTELDGLRTSIIVQLKAQRTEFEAEKSELVGQHEEKIKSMEVRQAAQVASLKAEHEEILVASLTELDLRRTRKFEANLRMMQDTHNAQIEEIKLAHQKEIDSLAQNRAAPLTDSAAPGTASANDAHSSPAQNLDLEKIKDSYEEKIEMLKLQHQTDLHTLEEQILASTLSSDLQEERKANQRKIDVLTDELDYLKEEIQKHKANENQDSNQEAALSEAEVELREALDALSTLDKALLESQAEREKLLQELEEMKKTSSNDQQTQLKEMANLQSELDRVKQERDKLLQQSSQHGRTPSDSLNVRPIPGMNSESPSLPGLGTRTQQLLGSAKPPPPTPPPNIPPPPLPTSATNGNPNLPTLNGAPGPSNPSAANLKPTRTSNSSSQLSHTNNSTSGRDSPSTSVATSFCAVESAAVDPRMVKKIEEQEAAIAKLSKQLSQCEIDLKGNIELVSNLESALNETERNLRKSRLQMNELAKERDKISTQNENLRKELAEANMEVESARSNVLAEKAQFENQLGEERRAKENAKKQLEARMEEMQASRMTRKSKFNCF